MADPLVDVAVRVYADLADRATLTDVLAVVARARNDLDTPSAAALPELVERLARQRLTDGLAYPAASDGAPPAEHPRRTPPVKAVHVLRLRRAWASR